MKMDKKIMISVIGFIIAIILFGVIWNVVSSKNDDTSNTLIYSENIVNISDEKGVEDECTEEWIEYNNELQAAFEEASNSLGEDTTHYLLKSENGYIFVYYLNENDEELLYKETTISVDYLSPEDTNNLKEGIEVVGSDALNKILEDFE